MKKLLSLLLALALLLGTSNALADVNFVFTKGGFEPDSEDNSIHAFIEESSGVKFNHIAPPAANYDEKLSILLAGYIDGTEDIDMFKISKAQTVKMYDYAEQGALLDLAPYLEEYMPHVLEVIPRKVLEGMMVDGKLYGIPVYCSPNRMNFMIRTDWLENLGLQVPTTMDELHDVYYAFTYNDPDGNGINDTVGYSGCGLEGLEPFFGAYGFTGVQHDYWYVGEDGKLYPSALHENAPACLKVLRDWYAEGIIDPEIFILSQDAELNDKAYNNYWGSVYRWWTYESKLHKYMSEYDTKFHLQTIAPPAGPGGAGACRGVNSTNGVICVMADSKNWEECLKLIDWYHTELGMMTTYSGVPELHWYQDAEGKYYTTEQFDKDAEWIQWYSAFESEWPLLMVETYMVQSRRDAFKWNTITDASDLFITDAKVKYSTDLLDYTKQMYMKFITGEADIDAEWENYKAKWYSMGGQEWFDELNALYAERKAE